MIEISPRKLKYYWHLYLFILIPLLLVATFSYYPIVNGIVKIFYRWNGDNISEFIGFVNIVKMFDGGPQSKELGISFVMVVVFILANLVKMVPAILAAVVLHHIRSSRFQYLYRILFVVPMIIPGMVYILLWKYFYEPQSGILNVLLRGLHLIGPAEMIPWLSKFGLAVFSLIFYGFPWIGAFSVLIYLSGLQAIPKSLYESAAIDGANSLQVFWKIELPLIITQIRINLVLMMIGTIAGWEFIYTFLGIGGGPGIRVPGLIIFREAFLNGFFGYGCAIGFFMFLITLALTYINNRFVRVSR